MYRFFSGATKPSRRPTHYVCAPKQISYIRNEYTVTIEPAKIKFSSSLPECNRTRISRGSGETASGQLFYKAPEIVVPSSEPGGVSFIHNFSFLLPGFVPPFRQTKRNEEVVAPEIKFGVSERARKEQGMKDSSSRLKSARFALLLLLELDLFLSFSLLRHFWTALEAQG